MSRIKQQVMASVLLIYFARKATSSYALKAYAFVAALAAVLALVSVKSVVANLMAVGLSGVGTFLYAAIANTTPAVQASTVVALIFAALLVRDAFVPSGRLA
jgi:hypothetical protein